MYRYISCLYQTVAKYYVTFVISHAHYPHGLQAYRIMKIVWFDVSGRCMRRNNRLIGQEAKKRTGSMDVSIL